MTKSNKKIFPKIKKKIKSFLTDESGKITKKDALGLAVGSVLLSGTELVFGGDDAHSSHGNTHTSYAPHSSSQCGHISQGHANGYSAGGHLSGTKAKHASAISNGHYNATPNGGHYNTSLRTTGHVSQGHVNAEKHCNSYGAHSSHTSHGSHGSSGDR